MEVDESIWIQDVSLQLFKIIQSSSSPRDGALIVSPVSIVTCLAMLLAGSDGTTRQAFLASPLFRDRRDDEATIYKDVMELISSQRSDNLSLRATSKLFVHSGVEVSGTFRAAANRIFLEEIVHKIDFGGNTPAAVDAVNAWIAEATGGRVGRALTASLSEETALLAVSVVAFREAWELKFDSFRTRDFNGKTRVTRDAQFMHRQGSFKTTPPPEGGDDGTIEVLELPYANENFVLDVFLPPSGVEPSEIIKSLSSDGVRTLIGRLSPRNVDVLLPRFKGESGLDLRAVLDSLGVGQLFSERDCDLSRITGSKNLHVSHVFHSALLSIDEEGTEASAGTLAIGRTRRSTDVQYFHVDRPFFVILRNLVSNSFLFIGVVTDLPAGGATARSEL